MEELLKVPNIAFSLDVAKQKHISSPKPEDEEVLLVEKIVAKDAEEVAPV